MSTPNGRLMKLSEPSHPNYHNRENYTSDRMLKTILLDGINVAL